MTGPEEWVQAWVLKAEHDWRACRALIAFPEGPFNVVCFHAQQCAEKYLKAFLAAHERELRRTHDIARLLLDCAAVDSAFKQWLDIGMRLTPYGVDIRYPDDFYYPSAEEAQQAVEHAGRIHSFVRNILNIES